MIVLDTHAWIWYVDSPERLGDLARASIEAARGTGAVYVSAISTWEVYMLAARGRLSLRLSPEVWVARCERLSFLRFVPVDNDIARLAVQACAAMHPDPADRIITATALYLGCPVATCDGKIQDCGLVSWVW
jgi:PIN domain nuclease of toxin-antitoxin system